VSGYRPDLFDSLPSSFSHLVFFFHLFLFLRPQQHSRSVPILSPVYGAPDLCRRTSGVTSLVFLLNLPWTGDFFSSLLLRESLAIPLFSSDLRRFDSRRPCAGVPHFNIPRFFHGCSLRSHPGRDFPKFFGFGHAPPRIVSTSCHACFGFLYWFPSESFSKRARFQLSAAVPCYRTGGQFPIPFSRPGRIGFFGERRT